MFLCYFRCVAGIFGTVKYLLNVGIIIAKQKPCAKLQALLLNP